MDQPNREFAVVLRADINGWFFTPEHRLRAALKVLLRRYGFRALSCRPYMPPPPPQPSPGPSQPLREQVTKRADSR